MLVHMWSAKHKLEKCQGCGTDTVPHRGYGLCRNCYSKANNYVWQKTYAKEHRAEITTYSREWAEAHPYVIRDSKRRWQKKNPDKVRSYLKTWRKRNKAPFCIICGEDRVSEWAHIIAFKDGGPHAGWNVIPLCPTHHRCFDRHLLKPEEFILVKPFVDTALETFSKLNN